jgi:hypothetical protein
MPSQNGTGNPDPRPIYRRPLLVNESASEYDLLRDSIEDEIKSRDLREHLWVEDVVNAEWEIMHLRGFKVGMIHAVMPRIFSKQRAESEGFERVLAPDISLLRKHIVGVLAGDAKAKQELEAAGHPGNDR